MGATGGLTEGCSIAWTFSSIPTADWACAVPCCAHPLFTDPLPFTPALFAQGVASLCLSWVFSPVLGALLAAFLFFWLRLLVLRHENAYQVGGGNCGTWDRCCVCKGQGR